MAMFVRTANPPRRALVAGTAALLGLTLSAGAAHAGRADTPDGLTARQAPGPVHAGNTFGWDGHNGLVDDETFVGPLNHKRWRGIRPGAVRHPHGVLTLNNAHTGTGSAPVAK